MLCGGEAAGALLCSNHFEVPIERSEHAMHGHRLTGLQFCEDVLAESSHVEIRAMLTDELPDIRPSDLGAGIVNISVLQCELVGFCADTHRDGLRIAENLAGSRLGDYHRSGNRHAHRLK